MLEYLKNYWSYKGGFLHAGTYMLKLQIDDMILGGMPKEANKT